MYEQSFELLEDEVVIRDCIASLQKFGMFFGVSHLYLTNFRIVMTRSSRWWINLVLYLLGKISRLKKYNLLLNLPIKEIHGFYRVKYGINKNVLGVKMRNGEVHKISLTGKYFEWKVYLLSRKLQDLNIDFAEF